MLLLLLALSAPVLGSDFADNLAECSAVKQLNVCLREVGLVVYQQCYS